MSRLECSANPLVVFFFFSFVLFLSFMWLPDILLDHPTTTEPHNLVIDPHEIRTRIDTSIISILGSNNYSGKGKVEEFGGLNSYIIGSLDSKRGILVATDVYGIEKPNLRRFVDKIAAAGYYVVAPDLFHGDPFVPGTPRTSKSWLIDHPPAKGAQDAIPVIQAFKSKGISTIGVAGFCWGGKVATLLAARDDLKAVAMAHPAYLTIDDIKDVKVPISILGAEHDSLSPPALLKQFEEILSTKSQVPNFVKIFPGVSHGWTMKYNITDKPAVKSANEAHGYILAWFNKVDTAVVSTIRSRYREAGKVKKFGGVKSYIAGSLHSKRGILVASDVFGFAKPNLRRLVDKIAAAGYYVVAPDFFNGDPWVEYSKRGFQDWLNHHLAVNGVEVAKPVLEAFKRKGISTIGIAGFCWGAKLTTILAARDDIKAVVTPHPTYVTVDDIKNVRAPISILGGGNDSITPAATIKQFAEVLATKPQVPSFVKIFPGYPHGWTLLYNVTDRPAVKAANKGHKYILAWFNKYLKY